MIFILWSGICESAISKIIIKFICRIITDKIHIVFKLCYQGWKKWTKFLLAVIYKSPKRYSNSSKTFKKSEKLKYIFMIILGLVKSFQWIIKTKTERRLKMERSGIYLISLFLTILSVFILVQRNLNCYPNYPTYRLYFGEVETPYTLSRIHNTAISCTFLQF